MMTTAQCYFKSNAVGIMLVLISYISVVLFLIYYLSTLKFNYWKKKNVPSPPTWPIFGNYANTILQRKTMGETVQDICRQFPDAPIVGAFFGPEPVLIPQDPEVIKLIMSKDFYYFNGRDISAYAKKEAGLYSLFSAYGDDWKVLRQNMTPLFTSAKMKKMFNFIKKCAHTLEILLDSDISKCNDVDIIDVMQRFTLQCIGACVFGVDTNTLESNNNNPFKNAGTDLADFSRLVFFKSNMRSIWPSVFYGLGFSVLTKELNVFKDILSAVFKQRENKKTKDENFIDLILNWKKNKILTGDSIKGRNTNEMKKVFINVDDDVLLAQAVVFFSAGFETSAVSSAYTLYELSKNKRALNKVYEEIDAYLLKYNNKINYECTSELPYLDACMNEAMRLYPVLGVVTREVMENYTLPNGVTLEKGLPIHIPVHHLHHNPEHFPNPDEFRPERLYSDEKNNIKSHTYMPFGEGPRLCIGE